MKYKAIGFDYGGVIGGVGNTGMAYTRQALEILDLDLETYSNAYFSINELINTGKVLTWQEFNKRLLDKLGQADKLSQMNELSGQIDKYLGVVDKKMLELVDALKASGYKVGLLSNTTAHMARVMRNLGVDKHFDAFIVSVEIGIMKPDPRAFELLANKLNVKPQEMIFIDDSDRSLSSSTICGFKPIHFHNYLDLVTQLRKLRVIP